MSKLFAKLHRNYRLSIFFLLLIVCFIIVTPVNVMAKYLDKPPIDRVSISYEPENLLKRSYKISPLTTATPADLVATATSAKEVRLTWTDTTQGEKEFKIERAYNRSFSEGITSFFVPADTSSYIDKTTDRLTIYYYRIKAIFDEGESDWSNVSVVLTPDYIPASPGLLNASSPAGLEVDFSWADYSSNEDGFRIERSTSSSFEGSITGFVTAKDVHICTDRLVPGGTYYYRVIAFNSAGDSQPSNVVQVSVDSQIVEDIILIGSQIADVRLSGFAQIFVPFRVDRRGIVLDRDVNLNLVDQKGSIFIPRNTRMLSANNHAVTSLYYARP
ncbi:MAG: fibronectin type III domain-containing protein, partial [Dehalococcoidales bacterium]|nr:fibronectin type III domain-containing protein [Dehalococcoidales bacterium]